jgi:hypothetical protein
MNSLPNELLWFIFMVIDMSLAVLLFKFFRKQGLYLLIAVNIILANIQVVKVVELFGLSATLGNILYGSIFFSTDILSDIYGKKEAKKGVLIGFISLLLMTLYMQLSLYIKPANFEEAQVIQNSLESIFSLIPRIALGSIVAYFISQYTDVFIFHLVKSKTGEKKLWLRNNISTMISQFIDSIIFVFIAFWGLYTMDVWWEILITTYLFKWLVAAVDTPFIYMAKRMIEKEKSKRL